MRFLFSLTFLACVAHAQQALLTEELRAWLAAQSAKAPEGAHILKRSALVADRDARRVEIFAVAMGLKGNEPMEFFLVGANGKDYESMGVTTAKASEVQEALIFIGMQPGRSINFRELQFWPRGDRVKASVSWETGEGWSEPVRLERMLLDRRSEAHMPENGLVFVGSRYDEVGDPPRQEFGADNTGNIATTYNDPWTVLDVPYKYRQGEVYNSLIANPEYPLRHSQKLRVVLEPELPPGESRVFSGTLTLSPGKSASAQDALFTVKSSAGETVVSGVFAEFLDYLQPKVGKIDMHLGIAADAAMPVAPLRELCALIRELEKQQILRPEGLAGQFYYEAFLPEDKWRVRENQARVRPRPSPAPSSISKTSTRSRANVRSCCNGRLRTPQNCRSCLPAAKSGGLTTFFSLPKKTPAMHLCKLSTRPSSSCCRPRSSSLVGTKSPPNRARWGLSERSAAASFLPGAILSEDDLYGQSLQQGAARQRR
jgi:hypothetical protein